jgi:hypothetical protein
MSMADNILPFPPPYRGDPDRAGWRRGRVVLSDADIDSMEAQCQRRGVHGLGVTSGSSQSVPVLSWDFNIINQLI